MNAMNDMKSMDKLERRLRLLPATVTEDAGFVGSVMARIEDEGIEPGNVRTIQIRRWIMRSSVGLAAAIILGVIGWWMLASSPRPALAADEIAHRMFALQTLHFKGTIYPKEDGMGRAIEVFVQEPDSCRVNGYMSTGPNGSTITDLIITPREVITIDPEARTATVLPGNAEDAKMQVSQTLQGLGQMMFGIGPGFKMVRSEKIGDVDTDVYENRVDPRTRIVLWLNSATQLPVRTETYWVDAAKGDRLASRFDTIEGNTAIDPSLFSPTYGAGWTITYPNAHADADTIALSHNSCRFGNMVLSVRYSVSLGNGDLLICWCLFDSTNPGGDLNLGKAIKSLTFSAPGVAKYSERLLHADVTGRGWHWRWSVLHPDRNPGEEVAILSVKAMSADGNSGEMANAPVIYKAEEIEKQIEALQKQTLPAGGKTMTLEEIEGSSGSH